MANERGTTVEEINDAGPGLVFKVYPEAVSLLLGSSFWSVIFFIMLITLGLDSAVSSQCSSRSVSTAR